MCIPPHLKKNEPLQRTAYQCLFGPTGSHIDPHPQPSERRRRILGARADEELKTINARIKREKRRLAGIFEKVDENTKKSAEKLIDRAAFMLVSLEDMEGELKKSGPIAKMQQGEYSIERAHPLLPQYNAMAKIYAGICKQLKDLLPTQEASGAGGEIAAFIARKKQTT